MLDHFYNNSMMNVSLRITFFVGFENKNVCCNLYLINLNWVFQMTFKRPATNRQLTFSEIATETRLPEGEVKIIYCTYFKSRSPRKCKLTVDAVNASLAQFILFVKGMNMF